MWNNYFPPKQTNAQLTAKSRMISQNLVKKGKTLEPVVSNTTRGPVCTSWWGLAWCQNLEQYADFANRLDRGKRYLRVGAVIDLKIDCGKVDALVVGSEPRPYEIHIEFAPLDKSKCSKIISACKNQIDTMESLVSGQFPDDLKEMFLQKEALFPSPEEITFKCSCPDWAYMCKHVAAVLYGIGVKFDQDPLFFFKLRDLNIEDFIHKEVDDRISKMLKNANKKSKRILSDKTIECLFGVI